MLALESKL